MRWIAEEKDEEIAKIYGKPTPAQLAHAALRIEALCKAFAECVDTVIWNDALNIPNDLRLESPHKALDRDADEIRVWITEGGYEDRIDTEQNIRKMEEMISNVDKTIANLRDDPKLPQLVGAVRQIRSLIRAFYNCAGAAVRRYEPIYSLPQFERAYSVLFESAENLWIWMEKCLLSASQTAGRAK